MLCIYVDGSRDILNDGNDEILCMAYKCKSVTLLQVFLNFDDDF